MSDLMPNAAAQLEAAGAHEDALAAERAALASKLQEAEAAAPPPPAPPKPYADDGPGDAWRERLGVRLGVRVGVRFGVRVVAAADSAAAGLSAAGAWWIRSLARASRSRSESEKLEEYERRLGRSGEHPGVRERWGVLGAVRLRPDSRADGVLCPNRLACLTLGRLALVRLFLLVLPFSIISFLSHLPGVS